jgi:hypothetical protein
MSFRISNAQFYSSLLVQIWTNGIALVEQRFKQLRRIRTGAPFCPAFIAAGVDPCGAFEQSIAKHCGAEQVEMARREIAEVRLALACVGGLHWSPTVAARRIAVVRDFAALLWSRGVCDRVSSLVDNCDHCQAPSSQRSGLNLEFTNEFAGNIHCSGFTWSPFTLSYRR